MFAVCDGVECIGGSSQLATVTGQEFARSVNTVSSASSRASNESLPSMGGIDGVQLT